MILVSHLHMPFYVLKTFTEYPYIVYNIAAGEYFRYTVV